MSNNFRRAGQEARLHYEIRETLLRCNPIEYRQLEFAEFLCMPTFTDFYLLQLFWQDNQLRWIRNTWNRAADEELLALWREIKSSGETTGALQLTINKETGIAPVAIAAAVFQLLHSLHLPLAPQVNPDPWGRDGEEIILRLGAESSVASFHWFTAHVPARWSELNLLAEALMQLNTRLK